MNAEIKDILACRPELQINIRGPVEPGLSGALVWFVDYMDAGQRRQGVLKLTDSDKAERESSGDSQARASWLNEMLPTSLIHIRTASGSRDGLLFSLAGDRLDNCQQLRTAISKTYPFGLNHVLPAIAALYQREAAKHWGSAGFRSMRDVFCEPLRDCIGAQWQEHWMQNELPGPAHASIIFEDHEERWPNPIAYFTSADVWPDESGFGVTVPWLLMHGDLNYGNVLCPTYDRWVSISEMVARRPEEMIQNLSLIDMPFLREMPYVYDAAFLVTWLKELLPGFATHSNRDSTISGYRKAIENVRSERAPEDVSVLASRFVECTWTLFNGLKKGQQSMVEDIRSAFLCSLSAAALWQSLRLGCKATLAISQREEVVSLICLSALALKALLADKQRRSPAGNDFILRTKPCETTSTTVWTDTTRRLGSLFAEQKKHRGIVLVLGGQWASVLSLLSDSTIAVALAENSARPSISAKDTDTPMRTKMASIGRLPLAAVLDWSPLDEIRTTVTTEIPSPFFVAPIWAGAPEASWTDHHSIPWIGLRGNISIRDSVALTERDRSRKREKLRELILRFRKQRSGDLVVVYAGLSFDELQEIHRMLDEIWGGTAKYLHLCSAAEQAAHSQFCRTWGIESLPGGITEFLDACVDVPQLTAQNTTRNNEAKLHSLLVAGMTRAEDGSLVADAQKTLIVEIPSDDLVAIRRAGRLLDEAERAEMSRPPIEPRNFFIGHHIEFADLEAGVAIERPPIFQAYFDQIMNELGKRHLSTITIRARPGAGASTALRWLAWKLAFQQNVPTILLDKGGNGAFEAIERLYRLVSCPIVVVADPQMVPTDELNGLRSRCAPSRLPVVFLTSRRVLRKVSPAGAGEETQGVNIPLLEIQLTDSEHASFLRRLLLHCPGVPWSRLSSSKTRSIFLLTLEAFGSEHVRLESFIESLLKNATPEQKNLLATVSLFSRYAHRATSLEFLEICTARSWRSIEVDLAGFDQLLVIRDGDDWICRHDQISLALLKWCLTASLHEQDFRHELSRFVCDLIERFQVDTTGYEVASDYVWSLLNPQIEGQSDAEGERSRQSRLINGDDGIPTGTGRERVFGIASETFPDHVNIRAHCGKFLSEELQKWSEGEYHISAALELEPGNQATTHMMGKRFADEMRHLIKQHPVKHRESNTDERIKLLATSSQDWFAKARQLNLSSEFGYTTALLVNRWLINDEFHRHGISSIGQKPEILCTERIKELLLDSSRMVSEGQRYIEPSDESRRVFNTERSKLYALRGDLATAIKSFEQHIRTQQGYSRSLAKIHLARLYLESGERV